jgi:hypothetical protein
MHIIRPYIYILSVVFLYGCSLVHFISVKAKRGETNGEYNRYLNSLKIDSSLSYQLACNYVDSISTKKYAINEYKLKFGTSASPVQIRMYNASGTLINGYEQCFGDISRLGMLDEFPMKRIGHLPVNYELNLKNDIHLLGLAEKEEKTLLKKAAESQYTIVVFYSEWAGWYSKNTLRKISKYIEKNRDENILFVKVNTSPACPELAKVAAK